MRYLLYVLPTLAWGLSEKSFAGCVPPPPSAPSMGGPGTIALGIVLIGGIVFAISRRKK